MDGVCASGGPGVRGLPGRSETRRRSHARRPAHETVPGVAPRRPAPRPRRPPRRETGTRRKRAASGEGNAVSAPLPGHAADEVPSPGSCGRVVGGPRSAAVPPRALHARPRAHPGDRPEKATARPREPEPPATPESRPTRAADPGRDLGVSTRARAGLRAPPRGAPRRRRPPHAGNQPGAAECGRGAGGTWSGCASAVRLRRPPAPGSSSSSCSCRGFPGLGRSLLRTDTRRRRRDPPSSMAGAEEHGRTPPRVTRPPGPRARGSAGPRAGSRCGTPRSPLQPPQTSGQSRGLSGRKRKHERGDPPFPCPARGVPGSRPGASERKGAAQARRTPDRLRSPAEPLSRVLGPTGEEPRRDSSGRLGASSGRGGARTHGGPGRRARWSGEEAVDAPREGCSVPHGPWDSLGYGLRVPDRSVAAAAALPGAGVVLWAGGRRSSRGRRFPERDGVRRGSRRAFYFVSLRRCSRGGPGRAGAGRGDGTRASRGAGPRRGRSRQPETVTRAARAPRVAFPGEKRGLSRPGERGAFRAVLVQEEPPRGLERSPRPPAPPAWSRPPSRGLARRLGRSSSEPSESLHRPRPRSPPGPVSSSDGDRDVPQSSLPFQRGKNHRVALEQRQGLTCLELQAQLARTGPVRRPG